MFTANQLALAYFCAKCDFATGQKWRDCPQCGTHMQSEQQIRTLGWVLTFLGSGLMLFMLFLSVVVGYAMWQTDRPGAGMSFTGGPTMTLFIYLIFAVVAAFGATSVAAGVFQIRPGRRNPRIIAVMLMLVFVLIVLGSAVLVVG
jgi:hypothetical protein